jgi:putative endonuclease
MREYFVYMMTNKGRTTLYIGVTNSLMRRVSQHRAGEMPGFSKRYNTNRLVYYERFNDVRDAIAREKQLKGWSRGKKEGLINSMNPKWTDLGVTILGLGSAPPKLWQDSGGWQAGDPSASSG